MGDDIRPLCVLSLGFPIDFPCTDLMQIQCWLVTALLLAVALAQSNPFVPQLPLEFNASWTSIEAHDFGSGNWTYNYTCEQQCWLSASLGIERITRNPPR